jgi:hypothetical protein
VLASLLDGDLPQRLSFDASYGTVVQVRMEGRSTDVLPLVHPGQRSARWKAAHYQWIAARNVA